MATEVIKFNFNTELIKELSSVKKKYNLSEVDTKYRVPNPGVKELGIDAALAESISNYFEKIKTQHIFVGKNSDGAYVCEYKKNRTDDSVQLCIAKNTGRDTWAMWLGEINTSTKVLSTYSYKTHKGTVAAMAILPSILQDSEAFAFADILKCVDIEAEDYGNALCGLINHIYYRVKYPDKCGKPIVITSTENIKQSMLLETVIRIQGDPEVFTVGGAASVEEEEEISSKINGLFPYDEEWEKTKEEEERIPEFGDWFVVPKLAVELAQKIKLSKRFRRPINTLLLYGSSGTGKTEMCKAISAALSLPYYSICPGTDADKVDLTDAFVPNTSEVGNSEVSFDDIENDFESAFEKLFGRKPGRLDTPADAYRKLAETMMAEKNDFCHIETELVQCFRNGGLLEIQEADVIKRASVLTLLNPILNGNGKNDFIQLANGEILRRNPNCVVIFTTNRNYEGCNELQQSIYSRISLMREVKLPTAEVLFERTKADTGFKNDALLRKMSETVHNIHTYCDDKDISSGVCGPRELCDWAIDTLIIAEMEGSTRPNEEHCIKAALETVLEAVAQNQDDIDEIISAVFCKNFAPDKVEKVRKEVCG